MDLGPHVAFILWSYAGAALVAAMLIAHAVWDARRVAARLRSLERSGIRRRSAGSPT